MIEEPRLRLPPPHGGAPGRTGRPTPDDAPRRGDGHTLFERDGELAALAQDIELARDGSGRLVLIEGPPGIGKTRLLAEARRLARKRGLLSLRAAGSPHEQGFAYGAVRQLYEPPLRDAQIRDVLLRGSGELARAVFEDRADDSFAERPAAQILHGLVWMTINLCERRPLILEVDDAHWVDEPSLRFLSYLARRLDDLSVLVLVAVRTGSQVMSAVATDAVLAPVESRTLRPAPLSEDATTALLRSVWGAGADSAFCHACHRSSAGNPLLLRELVRAMAARRIEPTTDQVEVLADIGPAAVARTVRARLSSLPAGATRLAEAAAVLGEGVSLRLAGMLAEMTEPEVDVAAGELQRIEVLAPGSRVAFVHPLVGEALRQGIDPLAAERAHARAAILLREAGAPDGVIAGRLLHAPPAGEPDRVPTLRAAARRAVSAGDHATAIAYLQRALAEPPASESRADTLVELAEAEAPSDARAATAHLEEALALIEDPAIRGPVAMRLATLLPSARPDEGLAIGIEAIAGVGDREPGLRRQLLAIVATNAAMRSPRDGLSDELLAAMHRERSADDDGAKMIAAVLAYRDVWAGAPRADVLPQAEQAFEGGWHAALARTGAPFLLGGIALIALDSPVAPRAVDDWHRQAHALGGLHQIGGAKMVRAHLRLAHGELAAAEQDARDALEAMQSWGITGAAPSYAAAVLALAALERGDTEAAARVVARTDADRAAGAPGIHGLLACRARLRAAGGDVRTALRETLALGRRFEALGGRGTALLPWRSQAAMLQYALGDGPAARGLAAEELELARVWGGHRALGRALTAAGTVNEGRDAVMLLEEAVEVLDEVVAPLEQARAGAALGDALHRGDSVPAARVVLRRSLELADGCGARPLAEGIRTALVATGARPRRAAVTGPRSLTASERRVAELARSGVTNREIAEDLFVSPRTVEIHLSRAYRKLGITSRAELPQALAEAP